MFIVKINMQLEYVFLGTSEHHVEHQKTQSRPLDFISLYYSTGNGNICFHQYADDMHLTLSNAFKSSWSLFGYTDMS